MRRFVDVYIGWLKENKIVYTASVAIAAIGTVLQIPEASTYLINTLPSLYWLPIVLLILPFLSLFLILPIAFYQVKYKVQISINWIQCFHQGKNYLQTLVLAEDNPSVLEIILELGPSVRYWALKLSVSKGCRIVDVKEIREEYNPQISNDKQSAWFYDQELERKIYAKFLLQATGDATSPNVIIELEKLANKKLEDILTRRKSLKNAPFESFWKDTGIVVGSV